jgi:hypothetical protein
LNQEQAGGDLVFACKGREFPRSAGRAKARPVQKEFGGEKKGFSQAQLQKAKADMADTDAKYQYRLTQIVLAYTISAPK